MPSLSFWLRPLLWYLLEMAFWIAAIVITVRLVKRSRAEKLLLTGLIITLVASVMGLPWTIYLSLYLGKAGVAINDIARILKGYNMFLVLLHASGIIFLVWAFWSRFRSDNRPVQSATGAEGEREGN